MKVSQAVLLSKECSIAIPLAQGQGPFKTKNSWVVFIKTCVNGAHLVRSFRIKFRVAGKSRSSDSKFPHSDTFWMYYFGHISYLLLLSLLILKMMTIKDKL